VTPPAELPEAPRQPVVAFGCLVQAPPRRCLAAPAAGADRLAQRRLVAGRDARPLAFGKRVEPPARRSITANRSPSLSRT
jgi:hypothetical protein